MEASNAIKIWIDRNKINFKDALEENEIKSFLVKNFNYKNSINFNYEECLKKIEQYKNKPSDFLDQGLIKNIVKLESGYSLVNLIDYKSKEWESDQMRNCLARDEYYYKDTIYSIRTNKNESVCSIEIKNNKVTQIQGKFNSAVSNEHIPHIVEILKSDFFKDKEFYCSLNQIGYDLLPEDVKISSIHESFDNIIFLTINNKTYFYTRNPISLKKEKIKEIKRYSFILKKDTDILNEKSKKVLKEGFSLINNISPIHQSGTCFELFSLITKMNLFFDFTKIGFSIPDKWDIFFNTNLKKTIFLLKKLIERNMIQDSSLSEVFRSLLKSSRHKELFDLIVFYYKQNNRKKTTFIISSIFIKSKNKKFRKKISEFVLSNKDIFIVHELDYLFEKILSEVSDLDLFEHLINFHKIDYHPAVLLRYSMFFGNLNLTKYLIRKHKINSNIQKESFLKIIISYEEKMNSLMFKNGVFRFLIKQNPDFLLYKNASIYLELKKELKYKNSKTLETKIDYLYQKQITKTLKEKINPKMDFNEILKALKNDFILSKKDSNLKKT